MTIKIIVLQQLEKGAGTCKQLADRMGDFKLGSIRAAVSALKKEGIVKARNKVGRENVWVVVD
jgi:hypothetical protein